MMNLQYTLPRLENKIRPLILSVATVALLLAGAAYLARGVYFSVTSAADYRLRWTEQHYVFRGKNPSEVIHPRHVNKSIELRGGRTILPDDDLGGPAGGYPPWSYFTGALFSWPTDRAGALWYFTGINLLLLALLVAWVARLGRPAGSGTAWLFAAALLATSSFCTTLGLGQYGIVVLAALVGAYWFDERNRWILAGCLLGVALTKVTLAGPFLLAFVFRQRWKALLVALAYISVGSLVVWLVVHADPVEMIGYMLGTSRYFVGDNSLTTVSVNAGMTADEAVKITAALTTAVAVVVLFVWRSAPMLTLFAIAGLTARLWTYHNHYDNLILVFLMFALALQALRDSRWWGWAAFVVMGLTLWPPARVTEIAAFRNFQWVAWIACLAFLLTREWPGRKSRQRASHA